MRTRPSRHCNQRPLLTRALASGCSGGVPSRRELAQSTRVRESTIIGYHHLMGLCGYSSPLIFLCRGLRAQSLPEVQSCATEPTWRSARFERRRERSEPAEPHKRAAAWQRSVWWCSCVLHVAVHARCTQSTRPPHSTSGRWRRRAGAEKAALSTELHCRVRHSHPTSLFSRSSRRTSSCSHAHGGAGRRWFFLVQKWQRLAPTTQHTISR